MKQAGQLRVAVGDVTWVAFAQGADDVAQRQKALVDVDAFCEPFADGLRFARSLGAGEIHQVELGRFDGRGALLIDLEITKQLHYWFKMAKY